MLIFLFFFHFQRQSKQLAACGSEEDEAKPSNFYVVEFRKAGKQPTARLMDIVCHTWVVPESGNNARCFFPADASDRKTALDLKRRLKSGSGPNPEWPIWKVVIRGRSGKILFFF